MRGENAVTSCEFWPLISQFLKNFYGVLGRILLIADNDGGHHANLTQQRADELDIEFVFLPPYSPMFNAIEPLWKSLKRKISPTIFEGEDHFEQFVSDTFLDLSKRLSFANGWIEKFLPDVQMLR